MQHISSFQAPRRSLRGFKSQRGQDLIEYALVAGFVAVAAGFVMPSVAGTLQIVFTKVAVLVNQSDRKNPDGTCKSCADGKVLQMHGTQCVTEDESKILRKGD